MNCSTPQQVVEQLIAVKLTQLTHHKAMMKELERPFRGSKLERTMCTTSIETITAEIDVLRYVIVMLVIIGKPT